MNKRFLTYITFALAAFVTYGCLDVIDLGTSSGGQILVVDAAVYNGVGPHTVKVKRSGAFLQGAAGVESPVSGAQVVVTEVGGASYIFPESEPGIYQTSGFQGVPGKAYQMTIEAESESYISAVETMPDVVPVDEVDFFLETELVNAQNSNNLVEMVNLSLTTDATFKPDMNASFLKYRLSGTYEFLEMASPGNLDVNICFINEIIDLDNVVVVNKDDLEQGVLNDQVIIKRAVDYRFAFNYCFTILQQSITESAYNFWNTVLNEYNRTGDIFESPPATLRGNISNVEVTKNDVIGLFSVIAEYEVQEKIRAVEVGTPTPRPLCRPFPRPPDICFNCLSIEKSSYTKPPCFD